MCVRGQDLTLPNLWILARSLTLDVEMEPQSEDVSCCPLNVVSGKLPGEGA